MAKEVALVVGAGPGLGMALGRRFAEGGFTVAIASRDRARLDASAGKGIHAYGCDAGDAASVAATFDAIARDHGDPSLVVYNASAMLRGSVLDLDPAEVQRVWQICCLGALNVGQQAARRMVTKGRGTILFTGATAALRGGANFAGFAIGKFGQRALAQSMARDLGPKGIHVAHVIVDGLIAAERNQAFQADHGPDSALDPAAIAEAYWQLHLQPKSAWTQELDLRPWVEKF
ncbi:MAG: SDR family NAD(P)-dependent oxidoreductase [Rhodospirillales bacterium]|nr:SDR family NAD(P)-dependent oxidoreductase [Rhodospirillales bacterium]